MAADGDCHHLCKLMEPVRHLWSISDIIVEIRNTVMPSDCSALRFGYAQLGNKTVTFERVGNKTVTFERVGNKTVTFERVGNKTGTFETVGNKTVTFETVGNKTVTFETVGNKTVTFERVGNKTVTFETVRNKTVTFETVGNKTVTFERVGNKTVTFETVGNKTVTFETVGNKTVTFETVGNKTVTFETVGNKTVTFETVGNKTVTFERVGNKTVTFERVGNKTVTFETLGNKTVTFERVGNKTVTFERVRNKRMQVARNIALDLERNLSSTSAYKYTNFGLNHYHVIAYKSLVRPVMEYGAACWDPYRLKHIETLEKIQKRALKCCRNNSPLKWDTLTDRRTRIRLCAMFKTYRGEPAWSEIKNRLQPPNYSSRNDHSYKLRERRQRTDTGKFSFLNRTIKDWNALPADLLKALPITKNVFKNRLKDFTNRR
ncbi:hypothetical protein ANN_23816 [Periplaneta americana]|uniref:Uncharacterized protein n=1 Tax=Periplaneta americana TaxID=6978 RepID=A0ABQ8SM48_PERAM|nr:hypothetical protein ANN_23816 [Periplaneta americana]